jgi:uncharacterized protein
VTFALGLSLACPLLDPTLLTFTVLALGRQMAGARVIASLATALVAGGVLLSLGRRRSARDADPSWAVMADDGPSEERDREAPRTFAAYARHLCRHILTFGRHYLLALLLAAWIEVLVPARALAPLLGRENGLGVILGAGLGGPFYSCGGGGIAIIRESQGHGLSPGAALAYLTFGPATTVRSLSALAAIGGRRMVIVFVASAFGVAVLAGYILNLLA